MSEDKPKLSAKERVKLKRITVEAFEPTVQQTNPAEQQAQPVRQQPQMTEAMKQMIDQYELLVKNCNAVIQEMGKFANVDWSTLSKDDSYALLTLQYKFMAYTNSSFDFKTLRDMEKKFDAKEFFEIVECHKNALKYTLMQTERDWQKSFKDYERLITNAYGTEASWSEQDDYGTEIFVNKNAAKKKKKTKAKAQPVLESQTPKQNNLF